MANSTSSQIMLDGPRNVIIKYEGILDTADLALVTVLDPALLAGIDNTGTVKAKKLQITDILFVVQDLLVVELFWDATTPQRIESFTGRGHGKYEAFGGIVNNAGAGVTGKILASTQGASPGQILPFSLTIKCVKTQT